MLYDIPVFDTESADHWRLWTDCFPYLKAALVHAPDTHKMADLIVGLDAGELTLWNGVDSAAITEFVQYPRAKECNVFLAGGSLKEIEDWQSPGGVLENYAFGKNKCDHIAFTGRKGFMKVLSGWEQTHVACIRRNPN